MGPTPRCHPRRRSYQILQPQDPRWHDESGRFSNRGVEGLWEASCPLEKHGDVGAEIRMKRGFQGLGHEDKAA